MGTCFRSMTGPTHSRPRARREAELWNQFHMRIEDMPEA